MLALSALDSSFNGQTNFIFKRERKIRPWSTGSVSNAVSKGAAMAGALKMKLSTPKDYSKHKSRDIYT